MDLSKVRRAAWETRRQTYGPQGHSGAYSRGPTQAGAGALDLVIRLHAEGVLSEGQVAAATGLDRLEIRRRADALPPTNTEGRG